MAIPAGLLLFCVGAATLWRTRRRDGSRRRRYARRLAFAAASLVAAFVVLFPVGLSYVVTHAARAVLSPAALGAPYEEVAFATSDGLTLRGWLRAVAKRRGGDRVPRALGAAEARAGSRAPWLRRAALRPAR